MSKMIQLRNVPDSLHRKLKARAALEGEVAGRLRELDLSRPRHLHIFGMKSTYSVTEAQSRLPSLIKEAEEGSPVSISRHNETVAYLVSRQRMEAIVETIEILSNPEAMQAIDEYRAGKTKLLPLSALDEPDE